MRSGLAGGIMICPNCGMPDVREVIRYGPETRYGTVYYIDVACVDCGWREYDEEGGM